MAIFHLSTKPISRSSGRSAVAAAAYRTQSKLIDQRQGLTHDYERRSGVEYTEIVLPEGVDSQQWSRERLWNAAELAELRKDARTAREWELALPEELTPAGRQELAVGFARELASRYGCAVDVAIHAPGKEGDQRNHHAHLLATTRVVAGTALVDKVAIELSDAKRLSLGLEPGRKEIEQVRELWAGAANRALEAQGREVRIDHRSLAAQKEEALMAGDILRSAELERAPETKLGWKASAMERRGVETERGRQLREVKEENSLRKILAQQMEKLRELGQQAGKHIQQGVEGLRERYERWKRDREEAQERGEAKIPGQLRPEGLEAFQARYEQWKQAKAEQEERAKAEERERDRALELVRRRERSRDRGMER